MAGRTAAARPAAARVAAERTAAARTSSAKAARVAVQAAAAAARLATATRAAARLVAARLVPARLVAAVESWKGGGGLQHDESHTSCEPCSGCAHSAARQAARVPRGSNDGISGAHHEIPNAMRHRAATLEPDHQRGRRAARGHTTSSRQNAEPARTRPAACSTHSATTPADLPETPAADPHQGSRACCQRPSRGRRAYDWSPQGQPRSQ